jgi:hypothetical protein
MNGLPAIQGDAFSTQFGVPPPTVLMWMNQERASFLAAEPL